MGIFRSNNVADYDQVDGIVIDESAPPGGIQGVGTGLVILAGQFERGSDEMSRIASLADFHEKYGKSSYSGNVQLKNKKFSALKVIRVVASDAVKGTKIFASITPVDTIQFTAKHKGVYGNKISVTIDSGSVSGKKYTIKDTNTDASSIFPDEVYDNVAIASVGTTFSSSKLVDVAVLSTLLEPVNAAATFLATGSDGTVADTDYEDAIAKAEVEGAGNFLFIDVYNAVRNSYLKIHAGLTQDKMVIVSHEEADLVSDVVSDVATLRDTDGRIIFAENWVGTIIDGVEVFTSPASWYASILSQTAPYVDPAYAGNSGFLYGVTKLKRIHTRDEYIQLMQAGISAFEQDLDIGFKIKSGVVTQIANTSKITVLRRRMADYLTNSIAKFLKIYQNDVNSQSKRDNVSAAINNFDTQQENLGILPRNSEVTGGKAKLIDVKSLNTNDTIAQGKFFIKYKRRIFSSMRFIVLVAEIGESVVVTEQDEQ